MYYVAVHRPVSARGNTGPAASPGAVLVTMLRPWKTSEWNLRALGLRPPASRPLLGAIALGNGAALRPTCCHHCPQPLHTHTGRCFTSWLQSRIWWHPQAGWWDESLLVAVLFMLLMPSRNRTSPKPGVPPARLKKRQSLDFFPLS